MRHLIILSLAHSILFFIGSFNLQASTLAQYQKSPKSIVAVKKIVSSYYKNRLEKVLREFVRHSWPGRMIGSKGHAKARSFIFDSLKKMGPKNSVILRMDEFVPDFDHAINMYKKDFESEIKAKFLPVDPLYKKWDLFTQNTVSFLNKLKISQIKGKNIVWEKKGLTDPHNILLLFANYDSIAHHPDKLIIEKDVPHPGADNNASGVTILLALTELIAQLNIKNTIRVVFMDFEQLGLLGSRDLALKYQKEFENSEKKLYGVVNLLMLGHDSRIFDKEKKYGNMRLYIRKKAQKGHKIDYRLAETFTYFGKKIRPAIEFKIVDNGLSSSGHINFWDLSWPVVVFSQNWENDFNNIGNHTSNDFVEALNMNTLYDAFFYITGAVISWAFNIQG